MTKNLNEDQSEGRSGLSSLMAHLCSETGHSCIRVGTYSVANFSRVFAWESNTTCLTSAPARPAAVRKTRNAEQRKGVMDRNHLCHCKRFLSPPADEILHLPPLAVQSALRRQQVREDYPTE